MKASKQRKRERQITNQLEMKVWLKAYENSLNSPSSNQMGFGTNSRAWQRQTTKSTIHARVF